MLLLGSLLWSGCGTPDSRSSEAQSAAIGLGMIIAQLIPLGPELRITNDSGGVESYFLLLRFGSTAGLVGCLDPDRFRGPSCDESCEERILAARLIFLVVPAFGPLVRISNQTGSAENYYLFSAPGCTDEFSAYSFPTTAAGATTRERVVTAAYLRVNNNCLDEPLEFPRGPFAFPPDRSPARRARHRFPATTSLAIQSPSEAWGPRP